MTGLPTAQARRAKVRNIGYGLPGDLELNFGRRLPALRRPTDDDTDKGGIVVDVRLYDKQKIGA